MKITVKLFAQARDLAGVESINLELPDGATVADLRTALCEQYPDLLPIAPNLLVALGNDYAGNETVLDPNAEIACFPPVSGG